MSHLTLPPDPRNIERVQRMRGRLTKYELVLSRVDVAGSGVESRPYPAEVCERYLLFYVMRDTHRSMLEGVRDRLNEIRIVTGWTGNTVKQESSPTYRSGAYLVLNSGTTNAGDGEQWHVHWSGRTQRDAMQEGEYPFICDVAKGIIEAAGRKAVAR